MDLNLEHIIMDDDNELIKDESGAILCQVSDNHGHSKTIYLTQEKIQKLSEKIGKTTSTGTKKHDEALDTIEGPSTSQRFCWPEGISQYFLDQYVEHYRDVGPMKKFRNKHELWQALSSDLKNTFDFKTTPDQCEKHLAYIKRSYVTIEKKRQTSGDVYVQSPYDEGMAKLKSLDDSLQPEVLVGVGQQQRLKSQHRKHTSDTKKSELDTKSAPKPRKDKLIEAMYDIHSKTEKKVDKRFNKMYNLVKNIYTQENPDGQLPEEISDSDSD